MATAILVIFMSIMVIVIATAYSRRSGNTGLDMSKIKQLRHQTAEITSSEPK